MKNGLKSPAQTALQVWMATSGMLDQDVSAVVGVSRSHVSRIRRAKSGANKAVALRLQQLTGISWQHFIEQTLDEPKKAPPRLRQRPKPRSVKRRRRSQQEASP